MDNNAYTDELLLDKIKKGSTPEKAAAELKKFLGPRSGLIESALERYRTKAAKIIEAPLPVSISKPRENLWYIGPTLDDKYWPALHEYHKISKNFDSDALSSLDEMSNKIVAYLPDPNLDESSGRGLVLGYVQSGKTSNFTAVIAKAADAGYRLIIVLSGVHNNLREQTQHRLTAELTELNKNSWIELTTINEDFKSSGNTAAFLNPANDLRLLAVIKKNVSPMQKLTDWMDEGSDSFDHCPVLVIDDEADHASIDIGPKNGRSSKINELLMKILDRPQVSYIGYTATPFANIFIDPNVEEGLYPRDFIIDLPHPNDYYGPEKLFGRLPLSESELEEEGGFDGIDAIRTIKNHEIKAIKPPNKKTERESWEPQIVESLKTAVIYFLLATAARWNRRDGDKCHSSMLVHTTYITKIHEKFKDPIYKIIKDVQNSLETMDAEKIDLLKKIWNDESDKVSSSEFGLKPVAFDKLLGSLPQVTHSVEVVIDNHTSPDRLFYGDEAKVVIAVGGNTLSRGLTLEGLVVSYFARAASAYDTLLQMGRWFGFRPGYGDLARIWTTKEMAEHFQLFATVESEIRLDIARYKAEDLTPKEFAVRVRTSPQLAITSALKMQSASAAYVSYSGSLIQTILFDYSDPDWLEKNWEAGTKLINQCQDKNEVIENKGRYIFKEIPVFKIFNFLNEYKFHKEMMTADSERLTKYIKKQNQNEELIEWSVAIMGRGDGKMGYVSLGLKGHQVGLINRAPVKVSTHSHANIKTLVSREDRVIDLSLSREEIKDTSDDGLIAKRPVGSGLLTLYPISKDSTPTDKEMGTRADLNARKNMLGVSIVFPKAQNPNSEIEYMSASITAEIEDPDDETNNEDEE